jgi:hypothetical protein
VLAVTAMPRRGTKCLWSRVPVAWCARCGRGWSSETGVPWIAGGRDGVDREGSIVDRDDQGCGRGVTVWNGNQGAWIPQDRGDDGKRGVGFGDAVTPWSGARAREAGLLVEASEAG